MAHNPAAKAPTAPVRLPNSLIPTGLPNTLPTGGEDGLGWPWGRPDISIQPVIDHPVATAPNPPSPTNYFQPGMDASQFQAAIAAWTSATRTWREGLTGRLLTWRRGGNHRPDGRG